jgi:transposase
MANSEEIPRTNPAEVENLIQQIRGTNLEPGVKDKIERLLRTILILVELLQRKNTSIKKLRDMIFGKRTEKHHSKAAAEEKVDESVQAAEEKPQAEGNQAAQVEQSANENKQKPSRKGHGHRAVSDYPGAKVVKCRHANLQAGDACPHLCGGRLYDLDEPTSLLQFSGQPLIEATHYERVVLRCAKCQQRYEAPLPEGVKEERYDASCDATIALMRYGGGLPWYRQAGLQAMAGVPLGEATLWERCEATADAALGIYQEMLRQAANGEVMHTDDTRVRILACVKEDAKEKGRATQTSAIVVKAAGHKIGLYFSGRQHAGENLGELLKKRQAELGRPLQMSDALATNTSVAKNVRSGYCLIHARRKVFDLREEYPTECEVVLQAVGKVYGYERETACMSAPQRLAYHQEKSGPVMAKLKEWIESQFADGLVEANSSLGKALQYWLRNWQELTLWLREEGAPLDNNLAERSLKQFILMRKNSLFFKTEHGAAVGDLLASLIQSCRLNGVNAWEYLVTIVENKSAARRNPQDYLPWNYKREAAEARAS